MTTTEPFIRVANWKRERDALRRRRRAAAAARYIALAAWTLGWIIAASVFSHR